MDNIDPAVLEVIRLLGKKWGIPVLHLLEQSAMGFGEIKDILENISASVLSELLNEFTEKGILEKREISLSPQRTAYFLTDFGKVYCQIIALIEEWGLHLVKRISKAQVRRTS
ncbi:MAG: helix-turn-helix transcriptional regulator [Candidatus Heimdallarchaeota archaeon]|nr:helix-turn-helix transcriptional regulator [Candidatus Heimdallarchaeota archaeon]